MKTKYSKEVRKKFLADLQSAKTRLDTGIRNQANENKETYICAALGWGSTANDLIMHRLRKSCGASGTVVGFLACSGIPAKLLNHKNVQEYRHRWLDALIEEFSK